MYICKAVVNHVYAFGRISPPGPPHCHRIVHRIAAEAHKQQNPSNGALLFGLGIEMKHVKSGSRVSFGIDLILLCTFYFFFLSLPISKVTVVRICPSQKIHTYTV